MLFDKRSCQSLFLSTRFQFTLLDLVKGLFEFSIRLFFPISKFSKGFSAVAFVPHIICFGHFFLSMGYAIYCEKSHANDAVMNDCKGCQKDYLLFHKVVTETRQRFPFCTSDELANLVSGKMDYLSWKLKKQIVMHDTDSLVE